MSLLCRLFGHRLNEGSGPTLRHYCKRGWDARTNGVLRGCDWCVCKEHGCIDCHGRNYVPPPAYLWCVQRGGTGQRMTPTHAIAWPLPSPLSASQIAYLKDFRKRYPFQLHPDVQQAIDAL